MAPDIYRVYATGSKYARDRYVELKVNRNVAYGASGGNARGQNKCNPERIDRPYGAGPRHTRDRYIELKINSNVANGAGSRGARDRESDRGNNSLVAKRTCSRDPGDRHRERGAPSTFAPTPPAPAQYEVHSLPHSMRTIALLASAVGNCTVNVPAVETLSVPKSSTATEGLPAAVEL